MSSTQNPHERTQPGAGPRPPAAWIRRARARRVLDPQHRRDIKTQLYVDDADRAAYLRRFAVLMALSTLVATFGIATDSAPVVIGAMLVAPLMTPLLGLACALTTGDARRQLESALTVIAASLGAIGLAWLAAKTFPDPQFVTEQSGELLSRTKPGTLDMSIALAAGAAGAYVSVHRQVVSALPGAAIAVALIPPLAAVGISLELGRTDLAGGAILLYLTNLAGIVFAAGITFVVTGVVARRDGGRFTRQTRLGLGAATIMVIVLGIPLGTAGRNAINTALDEHTVSETATEWIGDQQIALRSSSIDGDTVLIELSGPRAPITAPQLSSLIQSALHRKLHVIIRFTTQQELLNITPRSVR